MPLYPEIKTTQVETIEVIKTSMNLYLLKKIISYNTTRLYLGKFNTFCIECQIDPDSAIGVLSNIDYNEKCSLTGRHDRGTDMLYMFTILIEYIKATFPHVKQLEFDDYNYRNCCPDSYMDLAYVYYAIYGETWYMKKMGAYFTNESDRLSFESIHTAFQKSKETFGWALYDRYVTTRHPLPVEQMQRIFGETDTWTSYFTRLRDEVGDITVLYMHMQPWIATFIRYAGEINFTSYTFVMDVPNPVLTPISYEPQPYSKSDTRQTRRRGRRRAVDLR